MRVIHEMPTYILEADVRHDETQDIHTLDLYQTWPTMAKPYRRRVAQFNLPRAALARLASSLPRVRRKERSHEPPRLHRSGGFREPDLRPRSSGTGPVACRALPDVLPDHAFQMEEIIEILGDEPGYR